jgi:Lectin C-type domain
MFNRHVLPLALLLGMALLFVLAASVQADSLRIQWSTNKHYYQLFDQEVPWATAKQHCAAKSAHLVTITSDAERGFIYNSLSGGEFWIGASDAAVDGRFAWVTGEKWAYAYWYDSNDSERDYVYSRYDWGWIPTTASATYPYICEWSADNYVGLTTVPDLNGNGSRELAALFVDYITLKHTVDIRDSRTDAVLSTLTFKSGLIAPQGVVALADMNGNGVPEIGVLYTEFGQPSVGIKDAKDNSASLTTVRFLTSAYLPKEITVSPDTNGNGASEITVLGVHKQTNAVRAETRDSETGAVLGDTTF